MIATIEAELFEEHAMNAGFLWALRDGAALDPLYDLESLSELDERLEAHLDGLRLEGDAAWKFCAARLDDAEAGDVFVAAVLGVDRGDLPGIARILDLVGESPELSWGVVSALEWVSFDRVRGILPGLLSGRCPPELHYLGIAACAGHRQDPGASLGYALMSSDRRLKARALRAAGELGRVDLSPELRAGMGDEDEVCRFWASWSAALLGEPAAARILWDFAREGGAHAERACDAAMRVMDPGIASGWLHSLAGAAGGARAALVGAGALGDPAAIPWILECMPSPEIARAAAAAFTTITGVNLAAEKLRGPAPEGFRGGPTDDAEDEIVAMDPDESLSWPDPGAVKGWWDRRGGEFKQGTRYLLGKPISIGWLGQVLREGSQPARAGAAMELCIRRQSRALFDVRAPGFRQGRELGA